MESNELLDAALAYVDMGLAVFPLVAREKKPSIKHGVNACSTDAAELRHWWEEHPRDNVAIACGVVKGLSYGDNTLSVIMTRGLAEMSRIVVARGGDPLTCMGLAGMGDLVATCTSAHSRNQTFGAALAQGETLEQYEARTHMVVEGARACRSIRHMARDLDVEVPLTDAVYDLLYENKPIREIAESLFRRTPNVEFYGLK